MDLSIYLFATYVFMLLCATIWLWGRVLRKIRKTSAGGKAEYDKEQKLFTLYQNVEDLLAGFEEYVEESQTDAAKTMDEMKRMLEEVKRIAAELRTQEHPLSAPEPGMPERATREEITEGLHIVPALPVKNTEEAKRPGNRLSKTGSKVLELRETGLDQNEIARRLGISVREVSLMEKIAGASQAK